MASENPDQTIQAKDLLAALRELLDSARDASGVADMLDRWPHAYEASAATDETAAALPVLDHLPTLPLPQDAAAAHTLALLCRSGSRF